jgi:hypothetical protein
MSQNAFHEDASSDTSPAGPAGRPGRRPAGGPGLGDALGTEKRVGGTGEGTRPRQCGRAADSDAAISFDPAVFDQGGDPSNSPPQKTTTGGEDWLTVNFYVEHQAFEALAAQLDDAQHAAASAILGKDEVQLGDVRFIMAPRGSRQGAGSKAVQMRWRMQSEHGLTLLLLNRATAHATLANVQARATSLLLMRFGFDRVWDLMQYCVEALHADIVRNKLSRVDACVDLPGLHVADLSRPFNQGWVISRSRLRGSYSVGTFMNDYLVGKDSTGFTVGKSPLMLRVYDKLRESQLDPQKLAVLDAQRWMGRPSCATRVEFQLQREKLKRFGVDTVEDWLRFRRQILDELTSNWFRLTAGPVDRKHADRTEIHPAWIDVQQAFAAWTGEPSRQELKPLPKVWVDTSRQYAMVVGILKGNFAKVGKDIRDNEQFYREVMFAIRQTVGDRDMATEIARKALELGTDGLALNRGDQ